MKVIHVSTYDIGGAGLAAYRLHRGLLEQGVESCMIVANKTKNDDTIVQAEPDKSLLYQPPKNALLRKYKKIMRRRGKYLTRVECIQNDIERLHILHPQVFYTSPISSYNLATHSLVKEADIVHLHWIQNFVNFENFFRLTDKPIIWTLHDLNPVYGGFHHTLWRESKYNDYRALEDEFYSVKKKAMMEAKNMSVVAISSQMHELISRHEFFNNKPLFDISNSIDGSRFQLLDKQQVRMMLDIPYDYKVFLFANRDLNDEMKGLTLLIKAFELLRLDKALLICLGDGLIPQNNYINVRHFASVSDSEWLSQLYSASDFLVLPSLQEGMSQTLLEALCCGTPVVTTPVSGSKDIVKGTNGVVCADFTSEAIAQGISIALGHKFDRKVLRNDVLKRFDISVITEQYLNLYYSVLHK